MFYFLVFLSPGPQCTRQRRTWCCSIHWNSGIRRRNLVGGGDAEAWYGVENSVTVNFIPRLLSPLSRRKHRTLGTRLNNSNQRIGLARKKSNFVLYAIVAVWKNKTLSEGCFLVLHHLPVDNSVDLTRSSVLVIVLSCRERFSYFVFMTNSLGNKLFSVMSPGSACKIGNSLE